ncbi:MAG: hypothetical protein HYY04_10660 [Chloroflexi bacterium]|nr:hypothetical protein [Chloroflexota bacterium]
MRATRPVPTAEFQQMVRIRSERWRGGEPLRGDGASSGDGASGAGFAPSPRRPVASSPQALASMGEPVRGIPLDRYPHPPGDNGNGIHWVPITSTSDAVVDRFVDEAVRMRMKWVTFLNDGTHIGANDYLVKKLVANGIEPVMRIYTPPGETIKGDVQALVRHYKALGVNYYQPYNEPNLKHENAGAAPDVNRYLDQWIPVARAIAAAGGYPGFGSLAPGGDFDDIEFMKQALAGLKQRHALDTLGRGWISLHNYTLNHPIDYAKDSNGFLKFRWYDRLAHQAVGRSLPIIGTEGGTFVGSKEDLTFPEVTEERQVQMVVDAYRYLKRREPYYFAYTYWVIANEEGGGHDQGFSRHAMFKPGQVSPVVTALRNLV